MGKMRRNLVPEKKIIRLLWLIPVIRVAIVREDSILLYQAALLLHIISFPHALLASLPCPIGFVL